MPLTAPVYSSESLHSAVVELVAHKDAKLRYTTIQNWSNDVYNLVTKRAYAYEGATVDPNLEGYDEVLDSYQPSM